MSEDAGIERWASGWREHFIYGGGLLEYGSCPGFVCFFSFSLFFRLPSYKSDWRTYLCFDEHRMLANRPHLRLWGCQEAMSSLEQAGLVHFGFYFRYLGQLYSSLHNTTY